MTPADEARFLQLWHEGASYADIAQAMGCAMGTVASRAKRLVEQGKIQPRPRGGAYPRQQALARQPLALSETTDTSPVQIPVHKTVQRPVHKHAPVQTSVHNPPDHPPPSPDLSGVLSALVERLSAIEETLKHGGGAWFCTGAGICTRAAFDTGAELCTARRGTRETLS